MDPINSFWNDASAYRDFAVAMPSDRIAYEITYGLLEVKNKRVLDELPNRPKGRGIG